MPKYKRKKYRIRRYGLHPSLFVECKSKRGDRVKKRRVVIAVAEIATFAEPLADPSCAACWFHERVNRLRLQPACLVAYDRTAFAGTANDGPLRLTLDRNIRGILAAEWLCDPCDEGKLLLPDQVILELKFHTFLPEIFRTLVQMMRLTPGVVSKYRLCRDAWSKS